MKALLMKPVKKKLYPRLTDVYAYEWNGKDNAFAHPPLNWPSPFLISDIRLEYTPRKSRILVATYIPWMALPNFLYNYTCDVLPGSDALDALREREYDLVILPCPKLMRDVLEVVKTLKAHYPRVPVMILAGEASGDLVLEALLCGAEDCLVGNVGEDVLREKIIGILEVTRNSDNFSYAGIRRAVAFIHREYARRLPLDEMAKVAHMSRRHFSRIFRKVMGVSPSEYVNKIRIDQAKRRLRQSRSIAEVALEAGFQNVSYFYRMFKRFEEISPGVYRRKAKNNQVG